MSYAGPTDLYIDGEWTESVDGETLDALEYGMVSINEYPQTFPQTPFGCTKQSGVGREQGTEAIREYTQAKNVDVDL